VCINGDEIRVDNDVDQFTQVQRIIVSLTIPTMIMLQVSDSFQKQSKMIEAR